MAQATLNGVLIDDGGEFCDCWFEWGATTLYGMSTPKQINLVSGNAFNETIYNLQGGTLYHFRAAAQNSMGVAYGGDMIFVTIADEGPIVFLPEDKLSLLLEVS